MCVLNNFILDSDAVIESCSIIPSSNVTIIPQQYAVQMVTSGVPPIRLLSNIDCILVTVTVQQCSHACSHAQQCSHVWREMRKLHG